MLNRETGITINTSYSKRLKEWTRFASSTEGTLFCLLKKNIVLQRKEG
jgi:hypothetical protein